MPSSKTKTSPCSMGFRVPASTLRYGSALMAVTLKPRDFKMRAIEEVATPLPIPEMTPPETKITFGLTIKKAPLYGELYRVVSFDSSFDYTHDSLKTFRPLELSQS